MLDAIDAKMEGIMGSDELLELEAYLEQTKVLAQQYTVEEVEQAEQEAELSEQSPSKEKWAFPTKT